jgi:diadenosine tetraphosphate (Ap4A) HIT family hydrolase
MSGTGFQLDPRLAADTLPVARLDLCEARLMDDARFAWLVLVPQRAGLVEIADLTPSERTLLWHEVDRAGAALRAVVPCDKLNLGALGNIVRQLHVHVVARREGDAAWPGPVWGSGPAAPYADDERETLIVRLRDTLLESP